MCQCLFSSCQKDIISLEVAKSVNILRLNGCIVKAIYRLDLQLKTGTVIFDVLTMSQQSFTVQGLLKGYSHEMDTFLEGHVICRKKGDS